MTSAHTWLSVLIVTITVVLAVPSAAQAAGRHTITITEMRYSPASLEIKAGDTVVWQNRDDRDHTVIADDKSFNSGNIRSGASFSHTFAKPGTFAYGCQYHPRERGVVIVKE